MNEYRKMPMQEITYKFHWEPELPFMDAHRPLCVELECADDSSTPMIVLLADLGCDPIPYVFVEPRDFTQIVQPTELQIAVAQQIIQTYKAEAKDNN